MTFDLEDFSIENRRRCEAGMGFSHEIDAWSPNDWYTATSGELGELGNVLKKIRRLESGTTHRTQESDVIALRAKAYEEIGDVLIYLDLLAQRLGINLGAAAVDKWNKTSAEIGYPRHMQRAGYTLASAPQGGTP